LKKAKTHQLTSSYPKMLERWVRSQLLGFSRSCQTLQAIKFKASTSEKIVHGSESQAELVSSHIAQGQWNHFLNLSLS
jgi:hypothetical protein